MEDIRLCYRGEEQKRHLISYYLIPLPEVLFLKAPMAKEPLFIDYGTSYTTAGTYCLETGEEHRIGFASTSVCDTATPCSTVCELCPSVVAVTSCGEEEIGFLFGHAAIQEEKERGYLGRNSIFYDTKRWVTCYRESIRIYDGEGNTMELERSHIIRAFLLFIIQTAQRQEKKTYQTLWLTYPVKQRTLSLTMYQELLSEYTIEVEQAMDEAVAVLYHSIEQSLRQYSYESGRTYTALILDCGGGTSDMVRCDYCMEDQSITSKLTLRVTYTGGTTNFGGNNLTYRLFQYLKIRLAEYYTNTASTALEQLFPGVFPNFYEYVETQGLAATYQTLEERYAWAETNIPTKYRYYEHAAESVYVKVKGNFSFLWHLAEMVKKQFYQETGRYWCSLSSFFPEEGEREQRAFFSDFHLFVYSKEEELETYTKCPPLLFTKEEITCLFQPELYAVIRLLLEPCEREGWLFEVDQLCLSGQSVTMPLFRDLVKEFLPGRKAPVRREVSCARKWLCLSGAISYERAERLGRTHTTLSYEPAQLPYELTAMDYERGGRETVLLSPGTPANEFLGFISRHWETKEVLFWLKDTAGQLLHSYSYWIHPKEYHTTSYEEVLQRYPLLHQELLDQLEDGVIRLFVYADQRNWSLVVLEVARQGQQLYTKEPAQFPLEQQAWERTFFDGTQ